MFFTADTHFWHKNIIKYCDRPFESSEEMNEKLIENWNNIVSKNDIIYNLGDIAFCGTTKLEELLKRLNGNIILIPGNHDNSGVLKVFGKYHSISKADKTVITYDKYKIYLTHENNLDIQDDSFIFHGHYHGNDLVDMYNISISEVKERFRNEKSFGVKGNSIEVGVDLWGYTPVHIDDIMKKLI